jgi:hypothetical protein
MSDNMTTDMRAGDWVRLGNAEVSCFRVILLELLLMKQGGGPRVKQDLHFSEIGKIADRALTGGQAALGSDSH